ncbi:MAG TPA: tryptophan 7-halogenase [Acidimicrobiales bacterium]|nr:tryptophan 7-halogenase [Acidimicrobiales bacterium]
MAPPQPPFDPFDPCYPGPFPAGASDAAGRDDPARAHAVVVGAGLGGLTAAVALRRQVERVTLVERDALPEMPAARSGIPQARHLHALQPGGLAALERLLPGLEDELVGLGAVRVGVPRDLLWLSAAGWMQPFAGRHRTMVSASRDLIEFAVRRRVLATRGISLRSGVEVAGLAVDTHRVIGVDLRARGGRPGDRTERLAADLVVDASGRRSPAPDWLDAAGYGRPHETLIDAELGYASRIYRRTGEDVVPGFKAIFLQARPPHTTRMGVGFPIEGERWMLTLAGTNADFPPTDEEGFAAFARSLRAPHIADAIAGMTPVSPIAGYRRTANRRRHYEDMRLPDGFVALGDSACAFNPVYGQGMSAAALTAEAVERTLADHRARHQGRLVGATRPMQKAVAKANAGAWTVATGEDLRYPQTRGGSSSTADRLVRRYLDRVVAAAATDTVVQSAFYDVIALLAEPTSLLRPAMTLRVLGRRHPAAPADPPIALTPAAGAGVA